MKCFKGTKPWELPYAYLFRMLRVFFGEIVHLSFRIPKMVLNKIFLGSNRVSVEKPLCSLVNWVKSIRVWSIWTDKGSIFLSAHTFETPMIFQIVSNNIINKLPKHKIIIVWKINLIQKHKIYTNRVSIEKTLCSLVY